MPSSSAQNLKSWICAAQSLISTQGGHTKLHSLLVGGGKGLFDASGGYLLRLSLLSTIVTSCSLLPGISKQRIAAQLGGSTARQGGGESLSASEAISGVFATPSIHGPIWQACCSHSSQLPTDKKGTARSSPLFIEKTENSCSLNPESKFLPSTLMTIIHGRPCISFVSKDWVKKRGECKAPHICYNFRSPFSEDSISAVPLNLLKKRYHSINRAGTISPSPGLMLDRPHEHPAEGKEGYKYCRRLRLLSGACNLPHPEKEKTGGEDAYFICPDAQVIGVADGVGGWADLGVDAGEYARELMSQSLIAIQEEPRGFVDPLRVLTRAHAKTFSRGASTACILSLSDQSLQAANLGDSGFIIVRNGRTVLRSPVQQHQFFTPFQLESGGGDPPSSAKIFHLEVEEGDVVVVGTDGLFDNVYDNEVTSVVMNSKFAGLCPQSTAERIAALARSRSQDRNRQTPFSVAAQNAGFRFFGGKMDDITVLVSYILDSEESNTL